MSRQNKSSPSSPRAVARRDKLRENVALALSQWRRRSSPGAMTSTFDDLAEYESLFQRFSGGTLGQVSILEIGYGARPYRLLGMLRKGFDARGVDMDVPVLLGRPSEFRRIFLENGLERSLKSIMRYIVVDRQEVAQFDSLTSFRGWDARVDPERFHVGDAVELQVEAGSIGCIYSEDVFEHISNASLEVLVDRMASWLAPDGLALIRPNIFTGIIGGHLLEWDRWAGGELVPEKSDPWEHLRKKRFRANTFLNERSRGDFRRLFSRRFHILEEVVKRPGLGQEFLTEDVRRELAEFSDEELLSNQVMFVLRPKS